MTLLPARQPAKETTRAPGTTATGAPPEVPGTGAPTALVVLGTRGPREADADVPVATGTATPRAPLANTLQGKELVSGAQMGAVAGAVVSSASGGSAVGEALVLALLTEVCDPYAQDMAMRSRLINPTQMVMFGSPPLGMAFGNTLLCLAAGCMGFLVIWLIQGICKCFPRFDIAGNCVPRDYFVNAALLALRVCYPGIALGALQVLVWPDGGTWVVGLGVAGACVAASALLCRRVTQKVPTQLVYLEDPRSLERPYLRWCLGPGEWVSTVRGEMYADRYSPILREFRMAACWFASFELLVMFAVCAVRALQTGAADLQACGYVKFAGGSIMALNSVVIVLVRPALLPRNNYFTMASHICQSAGMMAMAYGYYVGDMKHPAFAVAGGFLAIAALLIVVKGLTMFACDVFRAVTRRQGIMQRTTYHAVDEIVQQRGAPPEGYPRVNAAAVAHVRGVLEAQAQKHAPVWQLAAEGPAVELVAESYDSSDDRGPTPGKVEESVSPVSAADGATPALPRRADATRQRAPRGAGDQPPDAVTHSVPWRSSSFNAIANTSLDHPYSPRRNSVAGTPRRHHRRSDAASVGDSSFCSILQDGAMENAIMLLPPQRRRRRRVSTIDRRDVGDVLFEEDTATNYEIDTPPPVSPWSAAQNDFPVSFDNASLGALSATPQARHARRSRGRTISTAALAVSGKRRPVRGGGGRDGRGSRLSVSLESPDHRPARMLDARIGHPRRGSGSRSERSVPDELSSSGDRPPPSLRMEALPASAVGARARSSTVFNA